MSTNIVVPQMGESIVDARVGKWLKNEGDAVAVGEPLVELETDKVDIEVAAPQAGVLEKIAHAKGADVKIGEVLGTIGAGTTGTTGTSGTTPSAPPAEARSAPPALPAEVRSAKAPATPSAHTSLPSRSAEQSVKAPATPSAHTSLPSRSAEQSVKAAATPSARRLAREQNVQIDDVKPSGPRVTKSDVEKTVSAAPSSPQGSRTEERVRMSKRRATIAKRLVEVQQTAAMLTTFNEIDMSAVMALRERQKQAFKEKYGISIGITSFFVKACIAALREFPRLNAEIQGDEMVLKHYFDIGIAVGAAEGLVVPVLHDADGLAFAEIERHIREFSTKASDGKLTLDDLRGGTFSITNGGVFGSLMSTPILNPPQVGILGLHTIKERPVAAGGQIVLRPMMYVALTYDHRIVDGAEAVQFLVRVKGLVEDPGVLLIES